MFTKIHASVIVRIALVLVLLLGCFNAGAVKAETVEFAWAKQIAGTGTDLGIDLALDDAGNVYTVGYFNGTVDFDPGVGVANSTSSGGNDIFISKLDTAGGYEWAQRIGSVGADYGNAIRLDANGNIYVTGAFEGMVDFDPGIGVSSLTSAGHTDIFIAKFNSAGEFLWAKRIGGAASDFGYGIAVDASGNAYTTGIFNGTVDFDPGAETLDLTSVGSFDVFIMKLNTDGNLVWAENFGSTNQDEGWAIALDGAGNVFATGYFQDTVDFDPSEENLVEITSAGNRDIFLIGFDINSGALRYIYTMGGVARDEGHDLVVEGNDLYLTGSFSGEADFDPGIDVVNLTSAGGTDAFISKFPIGGNWQWTKRVGGDGDDAGQDVSVRDGRIYTIGQFQGEADFDPNTTVYSLISAGVDDIFINTLDPSGNHLWTKQMGGSQSDVGFSISTNSTAIYTTGWFQGAADFDPNSGVNMLSSAGSSDVFISKLPFASQRYYVNADAVGTNDGTSWENAFTDLQSALTVASGGDEIWVAAGTYKPTAGTDRTISFTLTNGVAIYGGFAGTELALSQRNYETNVTILSGDIGIAGNSSDNSYHVVNSIGMSNTTVLDGFTITAGNANGSSPHNFGGGIYNINGSNLNLKNVIIYNNSAYGGGGGGMYTLYSSPTLIDVTFSNNSAPVGAGMFNQDSIFTLANVTFADNSAVNCAGVANAHSSPTMTNVTFSGNSASGYGAGICNLEWSRPSLNEVFFINNIATHEGGGMYNELNSDVTLQNVTFSGNIAKNGGGIFNDDSDPSIVDVTFSNNSAENGGGMYNNFYSYPSLTDVTFEGNTATNGGGIYNNTAGSNLSNVIFTSNSATNGGGMYNFMDARIPILNHVTFSNNAADYGGGMYNSNNHPVLTDVVFLQNSAVLGGGLANFQSNPTLTNVLFAENMAEWDGGGVHNQSSNPIFTNATFTGNTAEVGGGMLNYSSNPMLRNITFSNNVATAVGGGIANGEDSHPTLTNVILWGDQGNSYPEIHNDTTSSPMVTYSIIQGGHAGTGNMDADPLLGPLQNNGGFTQTMALLASSPAINAGESASCPSTDQRGVGRPQGSGCDIGAFEYVFPPTPTPTATRTATAGGKPTKTNTPSRTPSVTLTSTPITPTATHTLTPHPPTITFTPSATNTSTPVVGVSADITKTFSPTVISAGGISRLNVLIFNPNPFALTSASWTDSLPAGMTIANPAGLSNSCGGTITAAPGGTSLSLTGGSVPAQAGSTPGSCTVAINVTSITPGNMINTIPVGALTSGNGITNSTAASATLTVIPVTVTPSATATRTATVGGKPTKTSTPSRTPSPTRTFTLTPTATYTPTHTPSSTHVTITATWTPSPTTVSGFPTTALRDNFNRANGAIGNNWFGYPSAYSIASNQLDVTATGSNTFIQWKSSSFGADQEAYVTLSQIDTAAGNEHRLILKSQNSKNVTSGLISVVYDAAGQTVQVWTYHPTQGWVQHGTSIPVTLVNGDQFGARARPDGTVEVYRNGTLLGTRSITSWPFYSSGGYVGMWFVNAPNALLDNFGGGTR